VVGGPAVVGIAAIPGSTVNALVDVTDPPEAVRVIGPEAAVTGTVALTLVEDTTVTDGLATPLKLTVTGAKKFVPVIVTGVFSVPEAGEKTLIVGTAANAPAAQSEINAKRGRWKRRFFEFMAII
jgi:hypothetical protein